MGLVWDERAGKETVDSKAKDYGQYRVNWLPRSLGHGFVVETEDLTSDRPYYAIATFKCDQVRPWLRIDLRQVSAGRDFVQDMTALIRIAEHRFGILHGCRSGSL
jgi:hypothetical protein